MFAAIGCSVSKRTLPGPRDWDGHPHVGEDKRLLPMPAAAAIVARRMVGCLEIHKGCWSCKGLIMYEGSFKSVVAVMGLAAVAGCATSRAPLPTVARVDVPRYMGAWYVISSIPTFLEKGAYNAVERYAQNPDGTIAVTFTFHKGGFDGPLKTMTPRGWILNASGAVWGMRFVWPIKADYRIAYLNDDYTEVIVGRTARDYVWIMARKPQIPADEYQRLVQRVADMGYDTAKLKAVPQRWP